MDENEIEWAKKSNYVKPIHNDTVLRDAGMLAIFLDLVPIPLEANISTENIHENNQFPKHSSTQGSQGSKRLPSRLDFPHVPQPRLTTSVCFPKTRNRGTQKNHSKLHMKKKHIILMIFQNMFVHLDFWMIIPFIIRKQCGPMLSIQLPMDTQQLILHCLAVPAAVRGAPGHHWTVPADRCERTEGCSDLTWDCYPVGCAVIGCNW